jgi:hypothetical protein
MKDYGYISASIKMKLQMIKSKSLDETKNTNASLGLGK